MSLPYPFPPRSQRSLNYALAASLILHGLILFVPHVTPPEAQPPAGRVDVTLAPPTQALEARLQPATPPPPAQPSRPPAERRESRQQVLAIKKPQGQQTAQRTSKWSVAEKEEMNKFLRELDDQAKAAPPPTLAQRSLAAARQIAVQQARQEGESRTIVERIPNSPPIDPFSLELYLDALVKKLNRSAGSSGADPRSRGLKTASVMVRLNQDGSLRSFEILNAADQQGQIDFIRTVVEHAAPFAAFPPDLRKSAKSLGMLICILPPGSSSGFGFTRMAEGRGC